MSGQMSNGEIEGVLASIRRLLRDDVPDGVPHEVLDGIDTVDRGAPDGTGVAAGSSGGTSSGGGRPPRKLVLNPDAMVRADDPSTGPRPAGWATEPLVLTDPAPVDDPRLPPDLADDRSVPAWSAPLLLSDPVVLPADADPAGHGPLQAVPYPPDVQAVPARAVGDPAPDAIWRPRPAGGATRRPPSLEERIAELEAALARDEATWERDGGDPAPGDAAGSAEALAAGAGVSVGDVVAPGTGTPDHDAQAPRPGPRLGPAEVRAWIEAESLRAFGTLPDDIADAVGTALPDAASGIGARDHVETSDPADASGHADTPERADMQEMVPDMVPERAMGDATPRAEVPAEAGTLLPGAMPSDAPAPGDVPGRGGASDPWEPMPATGDAADDAAQPQAGAAPVPLQAVQGAGQDAAPLAATPSVHAARSDHGLDPVLAAAIRALVADTIRDELRGPLGEELTRSIRRLMRREGVRPAAPSE